MPTESSKLDTFKSVMVMESVCAACDGVVGPLTRLKPIAAKIRKVLMCTDAELIRLVFGEKFKTRMRLTN
jgi:hypothetical protein